MRLDHCWFSAKSAFYNVWVNRSLCKEFHCTNLLCFFFKNTDKFFSDNFTLCFRFCNSGKLVVVSFLCIDTDKVQVKLTIRSKYCLNFIAFILTKKTVIYKYAGKLFANCSGKQSCCHRGINSAWKRKKYSSVPNFFTDFLDGIFNKCIHLPFADTSTDILYKVVDHLGSFRCMKHFRMELDCIKLFCCIFCCKNLRSLCISAILRIFLEDGLDTHDRIKDIRSCISLKRCKAVHIKDIILGCLIGKISILNGSKTDFRRCLSCIRLLYCTVVHNLLIHLFVNLTDQILKTHHTAFSCLERLAVLSIHRTKT